MACYGNYNGLGKDGEVWNAWGNDVFDGSLQLAIAWINAKYGSSAAQQVQQNPTSDTSQQMLQMYQLAMSNEKQDNTLKYVGIGAAALILIYMMMDNSKRR